MGFLSCGEKYATLEANNHCQVILSRPLGNGIFVILVARNGRHSDPYATAFYQLGEKEWSAGHYYATRQKAMQAFLVRAGLTA